MRLSDLVNQVRRRVSEWSNLARNPVSVLRQQGARKAQSVYKKMPLPFTNRTNEANHERGNTTEQEPAAQSVAYRSVSASYLQDSTDDLLAEHRLPLLETHYPPVLSPETWLQGGWQGRYQIEKCELNQGWLRLYQGVQEHGQPVWIYEYCFSEKTFSPSVIEPRKEAFKQLVDLNSRLGDGSDFRILKPIDVICSADQPVCYLMTKVLPTGQLLKTYLASKQAPASASQVRLLFSQVLQTLQYLQTYRVNWPDETSQMRLPHGALSLESLWIQFSDVPMVSGEHPFFIHVSRFALWEHLFYPGEVDAYPMKKIATQTSELGSLARDFEALGQVGFALITGSLAPGDPTDRGLWPEDRQILTFYPFVLQLLGKGQFGAFKSVDRAIAAFRNLPELAPKPEIVVEEPLPEVEPAASLSEPTPPGWSCWTVLGVLLLGIGGMALWLLRPKDMIVVGCQQEEGCRLQDIPGLSASASINYALESSYWNGSFFSTLTSPLEVDLEPQVLLEKALEQRDKDALNLKRRQEEPDSFSDWVTAKPLGKAGSVNVGFLRTGKNRGDLPGVTTQIVAYDGIAIFVAYSDSYRAQNIPKLINGKIKWAELQSLFSGETSTLQGHKVKLYRPHEDAVVDIFQDLLYGDRDTNDADTEADFTEQRRLNRDQLNRPVDSNDSIYARMLREFENHTGPPVIGIGFGRISQVVSQCSVYPLAIVDEDRKMFPLLVDVAGTPIDVDMDLCGDKGAYWANSEIFNGTDEVAYPLGYELSVAYPECPSADLDPASADAVCNGGAVLAQKLRSPEGQYLLSETGLVPRTPIQTIRRLLWEDDSHDNVASADR